ncbi:MAG: Scr1 family TA system antitoxin-like transcriptional regulator [Pseudonocardiaceae bacterium]
MVARGERQRLLDTDRKFVLVTTEGALHWHVGSPAVMIAQVQQALMPTESSTGSPTSTARWTDETAHFLERDPAVHIVEGTAIREIAARPDKGGS